MNSQNSIRPLVLGVDPGAASGACAIVDTETLNLNVWDLPIRKSATGVKEVDDLKLRTQLKSHSSRIRCAVIEKVSGRPNEGVSSVFRFGEAYGLIRGILVGLGIPVLRVPPAVWKSVMNVSSDKRTSLQRAIDLYPYDAHQFKLIKDHNKAEATLLAWFAMERMR